MISSDFLWKNSIVLFQFLLHFPVVTQFPENKSNKSRVKFKDIELNRNSVCHGPLISMNNLISEEETFTDFLFSKHLFIHGARGMQGVGDHEKGYAECLEAHVEEALRKSLNIIRSTENKAFDLVLYKEALHHAVRISRALVCIFSFGPSCHDF